MQFIKSRKQKMSCFANNKTKINWTEKEQQLLKERREVDNIKSWKIIAKNLNQIFSNKNRTGKQCRQRYMNYVKYSGETLKGSIWTCSDDDALFQKYLVFGPHWSLISKHIENRSQNDLKNRFYGLLRKLTRKINKKQKQIKIKLKKPIKYEKLVQILRETYQIKSNKMSQPIVDDSLIKLIETLGDKIKEAIMIDNREELEDDQITRIIDLIHQYNLKKKDVHERDVYKVLKGQKNSNLKDCQSEQKRKLENQLSNQQQISQQDVLQDLTLENNKLDDLQQENSLLKSLDYQYQAQKQSHKFHENYLQEFQHEFNKDLDFFTL